MRKIYVLVLSFFLFAVSQAQPKAAATFLNVHAGYGTETSIGYYGFFGGAALEKEYTKKVLWQVAASYFSGHGDQLYTNEDERYNAMFVTSKVGYHIIGTRQSFFRMTLSAGPSVKWYNAKMLDVNYSHFNPDGTETLVEPIAYKNENGIVLSLYSGLDFNFTLSPKLNAGLFLDTYSHEILLEHFMPGIKIGVRL